MTWRPPGTPRPLRDRSAPPVGALFDLLLQPGVGFLPAAPPEAVELVGQQFQFVACPDRDALLEIAAADLRRALPQLLDRHDHFSGEEQAREERRARKAA